MTATFDTRAADAASAFVAIASSPHAVPVGQALFASFESESARAPQ